MQNSKVKVRLTIKSQVPKRRKSKKISKPPPLLTNSIQVLKLVERGRWRVQQTKLQPPSQKGSVALECFGLSKVRYAGCLSVSEQRAQAPKGTASSCRAIGLSGLLNCANHPNQFLSSMGDCNIVVLAFSPFLGKVSGEGRIPVTDELSCIKQGIPQVS